MDDRKIVSNITKNFCQFEPWSAAAQRGAGGGGLSCSGHANLGGPPFHCRVESVRPPALLVASPGCREKSGIRATGGGATAPDVLAAPVGRCGRASLAGEGRALCSARLRVAAIRKRGRDSATAPGHSGRDACHPEVSCIDWRFRPVAHRSRSGDERNARRQERTPHGTSEVPRAERASVPPRNANNAFWGPRLPAIEAAAVAASGSDRKHGRPHRLVLCGSEY